MGGSCAESTGADTLTVTPGSLDVPADQPRLLTAARSRSGLTTALKGQVEWSSADNAVATVAAQANGTALVTGHIPGTVRLTARDADVTADVTVAVTSFGVMTLAITPTDSAVSLGLSAQLTATATFLDNTTADVSSRAYWTSSASNIAPISNGRAVGASVGTTTISASLNGARSQTGFSVIAPLASIAITPATASVAEGLTQQLTATGTFTDNTTKDLTKLVTWSSSSKLNATVVDTGNTKGLATALAIGTTTITATLGTLSATATLTVTRSTSVCGNGVVEAPEVCDDSNTVAGDGCRADCRGKEVCGDGRIDSLRGEQCDDGNTAAGDGCSDTCKLDPFIARAPQIISGALSCNLASSNTGRKVAVDQLGRFYVAMICEATRDVYVATSADRGATWLAPVKTDLTNILEVGIEGAATGTAYLAAVAATATLQFSRTTDSGVTWSAARQLGTVIAAQVGIDSYGDAVYISTRGSATGSLIYSNYTRGEGTFGSVDVTQTSAFVDLLVDRISGNVLSVSDTPSLYIRVSSDRGATFAAQSNPPGSAFFSDWAGSNGFIYASGSNISNALYVIPVATPGTSTSVTGVPAGVTRAIDADALGNVYMVSQLSVGGVQLDRLLVNATTLAATDVQLVSAAGTAPAVVALPSNTGALVAYVSGTSVYGSVLVYP